MIDKKYWWGSLLHYFQVTSWVKEIIQIIQIFDHQGCIKAEIQMTLSFEKIVSTILCFDSQNEIETKNKFWFSPISSLFLEYFFH